MLVGMLSPQYLPSRPFLADARAVGEFQLLLRYLSHGHILFVACADVQTRAAFALLVVLGAAARTRASGVHAAIVARMRAVDEATGALLKQPLEAVLREYPPPPPGTPAPPVCPGACLPCHELAPARCDAHLEVAALCAPSTLLLSLVCEFCPGPIPRPFHSRTSPPLSSLCKHPVSFLRLPMPVCAQVPVLGFLGRVMCRACRGGMPARLLKEQARFAARSRRTSVIAVTRFCAATTTDPSFPTMSLHVDAATQQSEPSHLEGRAALSAVQRSLRQFASSHYPLFRAVYVLNGMAANNTEAAHILWSNNERVDALNLSLSASLTAFEEVARLRTGALPPTLVRFSALFG
jgi:hypothetical protein